MHTMVFDLIHSFTAPWLSSAISSTEPSYTKQTFTAAVFRCPSIHRCTLHREIRFKADVIALVTAEVCVCIVGGRKG